MKQHLPARRLEWAPGADPSVEERALLQRYVEATERNDPEALKALLREDAVFSMPPEPGRHAGREEIVAFWATGGFGSDTIGSFRCLLAGANRQPAVACYRRAPGESAYLPLALDVLRIEDGAVAEIVTFCPGLFPAFGLPPAL